MEVLAAIATKIAHLSVLCISTLTSDPWNSILIVAMLLIIWTAIGKGR